MSPADAAKLLELPVDATPEQIEARFLELRRKLEDKIAKAPTPGLQAKYRESLATITTAFETLTLAADSSTLPVLKKSDSPAAAPRAGGEPSETVSSSNRLAGDPASARPSSTRSPQTPKRSSSKEFAIVAAIAVLVLAAGGWFVMKMREDAAAAEAAAQRQKQEEEARAAALARKTSELRTTLATAKVAWDAFENRLREAERRTSDLKGELRSFRDGPAWKKAELSAMTQRHEMFTTWLNGHLVSHPAKIARAKAEQLLGDKLVDEAAEAVAELQHELMVLQEHVPVRAENMLEGTATVSIESKPAGLKFVFTDAYGRTTEGVTPAKLNGQPLSDIHDPKYDGDAGDTDVPLGEFRVEPSVRFVRTGWKEVVKTGRTTLEGAHFSAEFPEGKLQVNAQPAGAPFVATNALGWRATGQAPAALSGVPPGPVTVKLTRAGFKEVSGTVEVAAGKTAALALDQRSQTVQVAVADTNSKIFVNGKFVGLEKATVNDLPPGEHALQLEAAGHTPFRTKITVRQEAGTQALSFNFKQLSAKRHTCSTCSGAGSVQQHGRCNGCNGSGRLDCGDCTNGIAGYVMGDYGGGVMGQKMVRCSACAGKGYFVCQSCTRGTAYWRSTCSTCGGGGKLSDLQLSK